MSAKDRVRWDTHYRERLAKPYPQPDALLLEWTPHIDEGETGRALDVAAGFGQNGLWLAEQGYIVDLMEISRVALQRARSEMSMRNLRSINLLQVDLDSFDPEDQTYDIACVFRYLKRSLIPQLKAAVVPGGRIIYETFNLTYLDMVPEFNQDYLLEPGELQTMFHDWTILYSSEDDHVSKLVAVNTPPAVETDDLEDNW
ncbi:MAG: class I SAM-dependent methyltransferase [Chloroflexota bacterium]